MKFKFSSVLNSFYFLTILFFSGYATSFYRSTKGLAFILVLSVTVFLLNRIKIRKDFFVLIILWTLYCSFTMLVYDDLFFGFYLRHLSYFLAGYVLLCLFKENFTRKYETALYYLAIISLFFWAWQLISYQSLYSFMQVFDIGNFESTQSGTSSKNVLVYTIHYNHIFRNCGFTWEPGPFSIFLCLALYFNIINSEVKPFKNRRFFVLLVALLSTQSTTGYLIFIILLTYILIVKYRVSLQKIVVGFAFLSVAIYVFLTVDFLFLKIRDLYIAGNADTIINQARTSSQGNFSFGRFAVFTIGWRDFINHPFLGYAGASHLTYLNQLGVNINIVSGLSTIFGMYGIFWVLLGTFYTIKSSKFFSSVYQSNTKYALAIIIGLSLFSFHSQTFYILYTPMFYYMLNIKLKS
ncbi:hypothetical protein A8B79_10350 [Balneola sp. EhC07]|uniref:O-antigen ligase family protein n=1 Tax=Balneola sp. EhC07 TaxID=1849360 RepID=UPI0007F378EA|nr:O-antigen ligase family protein [Balneola sp. EhC07]OAN60339.1 hypothetical protein A8B79_10350 [Balneola sp. EhC07]